MSNDFSRNRHLVFGRVWNRIKAQAPKPLYRPVRSGWHKLTTTLDQLGLRRLDWRWRLPTEAGHWEIWLSSRGRGDPDEFARRIALGLPLQEHLIRLLPASGARTYRILAIGAGPLTTVGKVCRGRAVDLVCIDPLAHVYDALLSAN